MSHTYVVHPVSGAVGEWKFGAVITLKFYDSTATAMLVGPTTEGPPVAEGSYKNWWAIILADHAESGWKGGERVTVNPLNPGITIVEAA